MLKNKITKIIATILASLLAFSTLASCGSKNNGNGGNVVFPSDQVRGTHERTVFETNIDLAKNNQTEYCIVIGQNETSDAVLFAVDELRQNFFKATGVNLTLKRDNEINYSASAKVLSIGETSLLAQAGVTFDKKELGDSGYVVQTKGNSVFMVGGAPKGSLFAVYGWLKEQFEYEYFAIGEVYIEKDLKEEKLLNVTLKEKPDFAYRMTNFGEAWFNKDVAYRARFDQSGGLWIPFDGAEYHTSFNIVPPDIYNNPDSDKYHPEWYANSGEQLCFTRDPDGLAEVVIERMKQALIEYPDRSILTFTQQDHNSWCDCESCVDAWEYYGTNSAVYIKFVNKVAKAVEDWLEVEFPGREVLIAMFAYQQTEDAPVQETKDGYAPIHNDKDLILNDNVALFYCPIYANYYYDFNSEKNSKEAATLNKWNALAKTLFVWMYGANFRIYLAPYNNYNSIQENYRYIYDRGAKYVFDQHQFNQNAGTDWYQLKGYLSSNLQWKIDSDQTELIDKFFKNYYKDASAAMRRLYDEENTWFAHLASDYGYTGAVSYTKATLLLEEYWPQGLLEGWLRIIDDAYAAIAPLKVSNPSLYDTLQKRIKAESIAFRYMQIEMYSIYYSATEVANMKESLIKDCKEIGVRQYSELVGFDEYFVS